MSEGITGREIDLQCAGAQINGHIGKGLLDTKVDLTINESHYVGSINRSVGSFVAELTEQKKGTKMRFAIEGFIKSSVILTVDGKHYEGTASRDLTTRELELTASQAKVESIIVEKAVLGKNVYISRNREVKHELCLEGQINKDIYFTPPVPNANKILIMLLFETYDQAMQESESSFPLSPGL